MAADADLDRPPGADARPRDLRLLERGARSIVRAGAAGGRPGPDRRERASLDDRPGRRRRGRRCHGVRSGQPTARRRSGPPRRRHRSRAHGTHGPSPAAARSPASRLPAGIREQPFESHLMSVPIRPTRPSWTGWQTAAGVALPADRQHVRDEPGRVPVGGLARPRRVARRRHRPVARGRPPGGGRRGAPSSSTCRAPGRRSPSPGRALGRRSSAAARSTSTRGRSVSVALPRRSSADATSSSCRCRTSPATGCWSDRRSPATSPIGWSTPRTIDRPPRFDIERSRMGPSTGPPVHLANQ